MGSIHPTSWCKHTKPMNGRIRNWSEYTVAYCITSEVIKLQKKDIQKEVENIPQIRVIPHTESNDGLKEIQSGGFLTIWVEMPKKNTQIFLAENLPIQNAYDINFRVTSSLSLYCQYKGEITEKGKCPKGHKLQKEVYTGRSKIMRTCNQCHAKNSSKEMYSCQQCEFDICETCHQEV